MVMDRQYPGKAERRKASYPQSMRLFTSEIFSGCLQGEFGGGEITVEDLECYKEGFYLTEYYILYYTLDDIQYKLHFMECLSVRDI
jgi:hypothetical protein